jgi:Ca2+-binding RTX toxin-like protein
MVKRFRTLFNNPEIEKVIDSNRATEWEGSSGSDVFLGKGGNDVCDGGKGADGIDAGKGDDTIEGGAGDDQLYGGAGDDDISGGAGKDKIYGDAGDDTLNGDSGNDLIAGGEGDDTIDGGSGKDQAFGEAGNDNISGGSGNDALDGGDGNDVISGDSGNDTASGGLGDDRFIWNEGDGSDAIDGGEGIDTAEINYVGNTVLQATGDKAIFSRSDNAPFTITSDNVELFEINGEAQNDSLVINSLAGTDVTLVTFSGNDGNDIADARASSTRLVANGGNGDDVLTGGTGTFTSINPNTNQPVTLGDSLTGGGGADKFQFFTDPFANGNPAQNLNQPDVITDYEQGVDQVVFSKQFYGDLKFTQGKASELSGDGNLIVLTGETFAAAGQAAAAIAANDNITAGKGVFVYYNSTLNISRAVYSSDLANGGTFSVQANYANLNSAKFQDTFTAADFASV